MLPTPEGQKSKTPGFAGEQMNPLLDVKHSEAWNAEVLHSLVAEDPRRARAIGEGAVIRLWHGARSFERYRCDSAWRPFRARLLDTSCLAAA